MKKLRNHPQPQPNPEWKQHFHAEQQLICDDAPTREAMLFEVPGLHNVSCSQATLLGSPIGKGKCISDTIKEKTELLKLMGGRLSHLQSHDALLLLRHSFAIPKVIYTLQTACFLSPDLETFDETLRTILTSIVNVRLDDVSAWLQASLPVRAGGIGIRRTVQLAPSAYWASATGYSELVHQILPPHLLDNPDPHFEAVLDLWREGHPHPPPIHRASCAQRKWDAPRIEATFNSLLESANQLSQARLLAVSRPESGAWLNALPLSCVGLRMDDNIIRIAVGLRLGLPLCRPHECSNCGAQIEEFGTHGLSYRFSRGRHSRHASLNDIIKRSLDTAKILSHLEPSGLYRSDGKWPDGASVVPWTRGKILVWDATCVDTLAPSHRVLAAREAGAVSDDAEHRKRVKYTHLESTHYFIPVAIETLGAMGQEARSFFKLWLGMVP